MSGDPSEYGCDSDWNWDGSERHRSPSPSPPQCRKCLKETYEGSWLRNGEGFYCSSEECLAEYQTKKKEYEMKEKERESEGYEHMRIVFGKYRGKTFEELSKDKNYCKWVLEQDGSGSNFCSFQKYLKLKSSRECEIFIE
jgi:hypothetical protein